MAKRQIRLVIEAEEKQFSRLFKAFGDITRLRILSLLAAKELTVNEIVRRIGLSQPTVSRHLRVLREAQVVHDRREGQKVFYRLEMRTVQDCCQGFCECLVPPTMVSRKKGEPE